MLPTTPGSHQNGDRRAPSEGSAGDLDLGDGLVGALGGGSLPLDIVQEVSLVIDDPGSPFNGAVVNGQFVLAQADSFPTDPLITECRDLLAGL